MMAITRLNKQKTISIYFEPISPQVKIDTNINFSWTKQTKVINLWFYCFDCFIVQSTSLQD